VAAGAIGVVATAIIAVVGTAHISWPWLLAISTAIAAIATCASLALSARTARAKVLGWQLALGFALFLLLGSFVYHVWGDPATRVPKTYELVANGGNANVIPLFGEAGGPPQTLETGTLGQNGLIGGQTYEFDCWVIGRDGAQWLRYRRFGHTWYAPRADLHPPVGLPEPKVPHC
jgi:hypothetical protein